MKTVFNSSEVPHIWAAQKQESGRNANDNFYFKGQTIFSYGSHFPIATIVGKDVIFTMRRYSNTTAKHIQKARQAVSHLNFIYCYDVPVNYKEENKWQFNSEHENNLNRWKAEIKALFDELGNKRIRDTQSRVNNIQSHIATMQKYCSFFGVKINDTELKELLKIAASPDFIEQARQAKDKANAANEKILIQAKKAYTKYLSLWRIYDNDGIKNLSPKIKDLCNFYNNQKQAFTRLRLNKAQNRLETSKGIEIPAPIAKRAYNQLNGCLESTCNDLSIPVLSYTITKTDKDTITAGCHTIPKEDIRYIADLLKW